MPVETRQQKELDQKQVKTDLEPTTVSQTENKDILFEEQLTRSSPFVMGGKLINTILSNSVEKWPKFCGKNNENVSKWLKDITNELNLVKLTDEQKLSVIQTCLVDDARRWFINNMSSLTTWNSFVSQLQKTFSSPIHQELALRKVGTRQQAVDETVLHYYNDMVELFDIIDINMSDQYKVAYLKAGLKVSLKREVMRYDPQTSTEFLEVAQSEEKLEASLNALVNNESSLNTDYFSALRSNMQSAPGQNRFDWKSKQLRCFRCNRPGHFARNCFSKNY